MRLCLIHCLAPPGLIAPPRNVAVDALFTTEDMDAVLPVLRNLTGLALPSARVSPQPKLFTCCGQVTLLAADDPLEAVTRKAAPCDWQLYEMARESTKRLLQSAPQ